MSTTHLVTGWRRSRRSGDSGGNCVEVAVAETAKDSPNEHKLA
jgi:hypothetical protein